MEKKHRKLVDQKGVDLILLLRDSKKQGAEIAQITGYGRSTVSLVCRLGSFKAYEQHRADGLAKVKLNEGNRKAAEYGLTDHEPSEPLGKIVFESPSATDRILSRMDELAVLLYSIERKVEIIEESLNQEKAPKPPGQGRHSGFFSLNRRP